MSFSSILSPKRLARTISSLALAGALSLAAQLGACVEPADDAAAGPNDRPMCTQLACENGIDLELAPGNLLREAACARGPLTLRVCVEAACAETEISVYGLCSDAAAYGSPSLGCSDSLGRAGDAVTPPLGVDLSSVPEGQGGARAVTVALRSASGEVLYQGQQSALFEEVFPNGKNCGGNCWRGKTTAFDLSGSLAGLGAGCDPDRPGGGG
jgi:hypothetical protein